MAMEPVNGAPPPPPQEGNLQEAPLLEVQQVLDDMLSEQWKRALEGETVGSGVKHVVGGFSVVVRLPDRGVAYRLQPMKSMKAGLTWVAFYCMLHEAAKDPAAVQVCLVTRSFSKKTPICLTQWLCRLCNCVPKISL